MVEKWLLQVQETMILSLQDVTKESVVAYDEQPRDKWVLEWPGQVVIAASTIYWTRDVTSSIESGTLQVNTTTCGYVKTVGIYTSLGLCVHYHNAIGSVQIESQVSWQWVGRISV